MSETAIARSVAPQPQTQQVSHENLGNGPKSPQRLSPDALPKPASIKDFHDGSQSTSQESNAESLESQDSKTPVEKLKKEITLKEEISKFKANNYGLVPVLGAAVGNDKLNIGTALQKMATQSANDLQDESLNAENRMRLGLLSTRMYAAATPEKMVSEQFGSQLLLPPELRPDNKIAIPAYSISSRQTGDGVGELTVYDHILEKSVIAKKIKLDTQGRFDPKDIQGLDRQVLKAFLGDRSAQKAVFEKTPSAQQPEETVFQIDKTRVLPQKTIESLRSVAKGMSSDDSLLIEALPADGRTDEDKPLIELKKAQLLRLAEGGHPLVSTAPIYTVATGGKAKIIPLAFASQKSDTPANSPVPLPGTDGSAIDGALYQRELQPITQIGGYRFYNTGDATKDTEIKNLMEKTSLAKAAESAERLYGFKPGEAVKQIVIAPSDTENAYYRPNDIGTITYNHTLLKNNDRVGRSPEYTARHETAHLMDALFSTNGAEGGLSGKTFQQKFQQLKKNDPSDEFLKSINEKNFLPKGLSIGGHAQESEKELLASFVNSLSHPTWGPAISAKGSEFRGNYRELLVSLSANLEQHKELKSSPLEQDIQNKIRFMDNLGK